MTDPHLRSTEALKREVSADGGSLFAVMWGLWPYIWPAERRDLKLRVALAMVLLLAAKLVASAVSVGSGFRGGLFSSSLFLGCLYGGLKRYADGVPAS